MKLHLLHALRALEHWATCSWLGRRVVDLLLLATVGAVLVPIILLLNWVQS